MNTNSRKSFPRFVGAASSPRPEQFFAAGTPLPRKLMLVVLLTMFTLLASRPAAAEETNAASPEISITPVGQYVTVRGNENKFREGWWIKDGWTGGLEDATYHQKFGKAWQLNLEGRAIFDEEDYKVRLEIVNPDVGFVRAGFTEFRSYDDDVGGFFRGLTPSSFDLDRDLFLRHGDFFFETGLTLPNLPKLTLGVERQFRDGQKSLLEWGAVTQGITTRNIFPSYKDIDETVDILKVEIEHDIKSVHLADQFRFEQYNDTTKRYDASTNLVAAAGKTVTVREDYNHDEFYNAFRMDQHVNDKVYWSLGYLFTTLNGNGGLSLDTQPFNAPFDRNWITRAIDVEVDSHVVNLNTMFGPFAGFSITAGVQAEMTDNRGFTDAVLFEVAGGGATNGPQALIHSSDNKRSLEETLGLRYTKIPFTTLYAEARLNEQQLDLDERETLNALPDFTRQTDTDVFRQNYSVGFNTAPIPRVTLAGRYRHSIYENDYEHTVDTVAGYPAFITGQDFITDEVMGKLTLRPCRYFNVAFRYQLLATDIRTDTASIPLLAPGGELTAGNFDASIYTVSATVTPISRLYVTGLFSFEDTRTAAFANGNPAVIDYVGNVYTIMGAAGYALDKKTDLNVEYTYSRSDNFTDNSADGLPLGLDYQRHGLLVGLSRRISSHVIARLRYGYYEYSETSNGGISDYIAHLGTASCIVRF